MQKYLGLSIVIVTISLIVLRFADGFFSNEMQIALYGIVIGYSFQSGIIALFFSKNKTD